MPVKNVLVVIVVAPVPAAAFLVVVSQFIADPLVFSLSITPCRVAFIVVVAIVKRLLEPRTCLDQKIFHH